MVMCFLWIAASRKEARGIEVSFNFVLCIYSKMGREIFLHETKSAVQHAYVVTCSSISCSTAATCCCDGREKARTNVCAVLEPKRCTAQQFINNSTAGWHITRMFRVRRHPIARKELVWLPFKHDPECDTALACVLRQAKT